MPTKMIAVLCPSDLPRTCAYHEISDHRCHLRSLFSCTHAGYTEPAVLVVMGSASSLVVNQPNVVYAASNTSVVLTAWATNFTSTAYTWTRVPDVSNEFAATGTATFTTIHSGKKAVKATLSAKGVYQFQDTATDRTNWSQRVSSGASKRLRMTLI